MTKQEQRHHRRPRVNLPSKNKKPIPKENESDDRVSEKKNRLEDLFQENEISTGNLNEIITKEDTLNLKEKVSISTDEWKKTFRKTNTIELANLIKNSTITHNSLIRLTGSYSTKMLANLKLNNKIMSGIENKPSKIFYNQNTNITQAINNDILSYIPYFFNYTSYFNDDEETKIYMDNLTIINDNLYFTLFLNSEESVEIECINITKENIIIGNINNLEKDNYLQIIITEINNSKKARDLIIENKKSNCVFMELDKQNKRLYPYIIKNEKILQFSYDNLIEICQKLIQKQDNNNQYLDIKNKYEFTRKVIE